MPNASSLVNEVLRDTTKEGYDFEHPLHELGKELWELEQRGDVTQLKIDAYARSMSEDRARDRPDLARQWGAEINRLKAHQANELAMSAAGEAYSHAINYRYTPDGDRYFIVDDLGVGSSGNFDIVGCKAGFFRVYDGVLEDGVDLEGVIEKLQNIAESDDFLTRRLRADGMSQGFVQLSLEELGLTKVEIREMPKQLVENGVSIKPYNLDNPTQFQALNQALNQAEQRVLKTQ